jgi:hypothetical protein
VLLTFLTRYSDCKLANLRFPLVVMIDYLGSRLIAEPILPIDKTTLVRPKKYTLQPSTKEFAGVRFE